MGKAAGGKGAAKMAASWGKVKVVDAKGHSETGLDSVLSPSTAGMQTEAVSGQAVGTNSASRERSHSEVSVSNRSSKRRGKCKTTS